MVNPEEAALATPSSSAAPQAQAQPAQQNITVTNSSILHPSPSTAIPLTLPTDGINGRKILNVNSVFSAFMTRS